MTTINDIRDLVRIVEDHPEWRSELQRLLLTRELLDTPDKITELTAVTENIAKAASSLLEVAEATNKRLDAFDNRFDRIDDKIDGMNRGFGEKIEETNQKIDGLERNLGDKIAEVNEATNQKIDGMNLDLGKKIDEIRISHQDEHNTLHRFRGNYAIETTRNRDGDIAELFATVRGINRFRLRTLTREERDNLFDDNLDSIDLLATEGNVSKSFPTGDIIAEASYRRSGDTIFYIAVEASYTVNANDVIRASDHAKILREVKGREAFAIVSGVEVNPRMGDAYRQRMIEDINEYMESEREDVVFWFKLEDRSLEPTPPC